jgi:hypothetical protein
MVVDGTVLMRVQGAGASGGHEIRSEVRVQWLENHLSFSQKICLRGISLVFEHFTESERGTLHQ